MDSQNPQIGRAKDNSSQLVPDSPYGPTLSTSTSSFEALDSHDPALNSLAINMFAKTQDYIVNELETSLEDYKLLEQMNNATIVKYSDMRQIAQNLSVTTNELSSRFANLAVLLQCLEDIGDTVDKLEAAAFKLDAYSITLENRVKSVLQQYKQTF